MIPQLIVAGVAAVGIKRTHDYLTTSNHDWMLRKTHNKVEKSSSESATILVDHVNDNVDADGNCAGELDADYIPDLIVKDFHNQNLIIEVETSESLESDPGHAKAQLSSFKKHGYRRVLVCDDTTVGKQFVERNDLDGVVVAKASNIDQLL